MCEPTTIALVGLGLNVASQVASHVGQNKASKENEREARRAEVIDLGAINLRERQESQSAMQLLEEADRQTRTVVSQARVSAGEAGVAGNSVDALLNQIEAEGATFKQDVKFNTKNTIQQLEREKLGVSARADSRVAAAPRANPFLTGLRIGGAALDTVTQLRGRRPVSG